jgi:periplasmic protein TonB
MNASASYASGKSWGQRSLGLAIVALLHVAVIALLVNTLAHRAATIPPVLVETTLVSAAPPPVDVPPPPQPTVQPPPVAAAPVPTPPPRPILRRPEAKPAIAPRPAPPAPPPAAITVPPPLPAPAPVQIAPHLDPRASREPEYPPLSRHLGEQGSVVLQVLVASDGRVLDTKLIQSSGFARLDQAALAEIKSAYRFVPGTVNGKVQPMWLTIKYNWRLR